MKTLTKNDSKRASCFYVAEKDGRYFRYDKSWKDFSFVEDIFEADKAYHPNTKVTDFAIKNSEAYKALKDAKLVRIRLSVETQRTIEILN